MNKSISKLSYLPLLCLLGFFLALTRTHAYADNIEQPKPKNFIVAAAHPLAANAGIKILSNGGSATDAAIAIQAVLGLVEPQSSGIAGGGFILHYDASANELTSWDGRETAPSAITPEIFSNRAETLEGFIKAMTSTDAVGVPGIPALLETVHKKYGRLDWADLFSPAIKLATEGFKITSRLHYLLSADSFIQNSPSARSIYFIQPDDTDKISSDYSTKLKAKPIGTLIKNPEYAETLIKLAENGAKSFYVGENSKKIISDLADLNPKQKLRQKDFSSYQAKQRDNLCLPYRTYKVCSMGPPSSGGVALLQILGMMSHFDLSTHDIDDARVIHLITESTRLAFADREKYIGDPDFINVPVTSLLEASYIKSRSELINPEKSLKNITPGVIKNLSFLTPTYSLEQQSTTHFVVRDAEGNVVSMTSSVEAAFGSRIMSGGMFLNNQLTDFSFSPKKDGFTVANSVAPSKRPRSSMTPVIIFNQDGSFFAAIGSPGGPKIISYVAQTVIALLDYGLSMQEAINLPRHVTTGKTIELEADTRLSELKSKMEAMGHKVILKRQHSGLHGIRLLRDNSLEILDGGADPRREGRVLLQ
ncbi:MAG: gamma-glutamyltransferase [Candidatus Micropelagos thuwalensis]